jgi:hypothetical protein
MASPEAKLRKTCNGCVHFDNSPGTFEQAFPGLTSFSSASASVRDQDGICLLHERLVAPRSRCQQYKPTYGY